MMGSTKTKYTGILLALLAVTIWSFNFTLAKGVVRQIPPVSLAFYRWSLATILIIPFALRSFRNDWPVIKQSGAYLFWASLTGVAVFNTLVYFGAHYTTAINLALIGTTSSPVFALIFATIFLKEKAGFWKIAGSILCLSGVLYLLSGGNLNNLLSLQFTYGDLWPLLAGFSFAIYTTLTRKKPAGISPRSFLLATFSIGTILLLPFYIWENMHTAPVEWNINLWLAILFVGLGASVISFLSWNTAIACLGAGRTALFGNLIPVLTSVQATLLLGEDFTTIHYISMIIVFVGIVIANWKTSK